MGNITPKVLALEAAVLALARTHPDRNKLFYEFMQVFTDMSQTLGKADSNNPNLGKQFTIEGHTLDTKLK